MRKEKTIEFQEPQILNVDPNTILKDEKIELRVLSMALNDKDRQSSVVGALNEDCFFYPQNRELFNLVKLLHKNIQSSNMWFSAQDLVSELEQNKNLASKFNLLTPEFIYHFSTIPFSESSFERDLNTLLELKKLRFLQAFFNKYSTVMTQNQRSDIKYSDILNQFEQFVYENGSKNIEDSGFVSLEKSSSELVNYLQNFDPSVDQIRGLKTGYKAIDKYIKGFTESQVIVLAARPGVGKTALALNIALNITTSHLDEQNTNPSLIQEYHDLNSQNAINELSNDTQDESVDSANRPKNVVFISLEMPVQELTARLVSSDSQVALSLINHPEELVGNTGELSKIIIKQATTLSKAHIYIDDNTSSSIFDITRKLKDMKKKLHGKLDLVVIDYIQLISAPDVNGNRQNEIAFISRSLKQFALEQKVPILALSQLSRSVETREQKTPQLIDLSDSSAIEKDADIVIFLHRDVVDNKKKSDHNDNPSKFINALKDSDLKNKQENSSYSLTHVTIAKNRNGQPGKSTLVYRGDIVRFIDDSFDNE
ncbi:DnaB-like helicase C-terminal domain-containing protein [Mycoplasma corogypsi]|uniref:DnaB-like helicase C-terminal domain-containing protein n=1 Tax=Mycoplasma corogypsi TaxID=2106 RepID=UPI003872A932